MSKHSIGISNAPWSEARLDLLRKYWRAGKTAAEIVKLLGGTTRNAVIGKAHRLGLAGRPSPIKPGTESGQKPAKKPTPKPVVMEKPKRVEFWTSGRIDVLRAGYAVDTMLSIASIANKIGCTERRVYDKARDLGLVHPTRFQRRDGRPGGVAKAIDITMADRLARRKPVAANDSRNIPLADLDRSQCHFPTSPHMAAPHQHFFCGAPVERSPDGGMDRYCSHHRAVAVRATVSLDERAEDNARARMAAE